MKKNNGFTKKDFLKGTVRTNGNWVVPGAPKPFLTKTEVLKWLKDNERNTSEPNEPVLPNDTVDTSDSPKIDLTENLDK
jgi:hypothetical protein